MLLLKENFLASFRITTESHGGHDIVGVHTHVDQSTLHWKCQHLRRAVASSDNTMRAYIMKAKILIAHVLLIYARTVKLFMTTITRHMREIR